MKKGYGANHTLLWKTRETSSVKNTFVNVQKYYIFVYLYYTYFREKIYWESIQIKEETKVIVTYIVVL